MNHIIQDPSTIVLPSTPRICRGHQDQRIAWKAFPGLMPRLGYAGVQDMFMSYSNFGRVPDMLLVQCIRGNDRAVMDGAWAAGMVSAMTDWRSLFSVHQSC